MLCIAGIKPINVAELVIVATKRGIMVEKEAKPTAKPKILPSPIFAMTLCLRFSLSKEILVFAISKNYKNPGDFRGMIFSFN